MAIDTTNDMLQQLDHVACMLAKQSDQVLQEQLGIGLAQFKILQALRTEPRTMQREIAHALGQTEASISRQVKLMLERGLLQSMRKADDHREHLTVVTHKGERLAEAAITALARYHHATFEMYSDKQREQLLAALEILHGRVCSNAHLASNTQQERLV